MIKKKKIILDVSRDLFNEKGYHNVTIRMIALKVGMSSGNLNYHYKKREDIFEALYFEMVLAFDERINNLTNTEVSIKQIRADVKQSMERMLDYKFFWTDLYNLIKVSDKVKEHFQEVYKNRINGCYLLFERMKEHDLMRESSFELEYEFLAERMINYGNTWLYSSRLYLNKLNEKDIDNKVNVFLSMFFPFLTPLGQKEFKHLVPKLFC